MNNMVKYSLYLLAAGALAVSCADYNELDTFSVNPTSSYELPYGDLRPIKSYLNNADNPNMSVHAGIALTDFNKQALEHAAAVTNFDGVAFGYSFMPKTCVSKKGYMNLMPLKDALSHMKTTGGEVYGSPIVANDQQADEWFETLTAPIEIAVIPIPDKEIDYSTVDKYEGTYKGKKPSIVKNYDSNGNVLRLQKMSMGVYIIEGFPVDPLGYYTITFTVKSEIAKDETINCTFAGNKQMDGAKAKNFIIRPGVWQTIKIETEPAAGVTDGYLMIEGNLNSALNIRNVQVSHTPDNHRDQTKEEKNDTIQYALKKWCDGLMEANAGCIKSFDLIDKAIDSKTTLDGVTFEGESVYDLKHSTEQIFWQDYLEDETHTGSELYAPTVSKVAKEAFEKHGGNVEDLRFFICETGLEKKKVFNSLRYWIGVWKGNGAKIDGINAELNLTYSEDETTQAANVATLNTLLDNLVSTGMLIRLSNFDIKYQDAEGNAVSAKNITTEQRQKLADYYAYVIKTYMTKIPSAQQAGLCKGNMVDTASDPVGIWADDSNNGWVRTATYKAFCDALSGK